MQLFLHPLSHCLFFAKQWPHLFCLDQRCCSPALPGRWEGCGQELQLRVCQNDPLSQSCGSQREKHTGREHELHKHPKDEKERGQKDPDSVTGS